MKSFIVAGLLAATAITGVTAAISQTAEPSPPPPPRPARNTARSASTRRAWTRRVAPGDDFYDLRQRHLGEDHADPRRQVELRHVQPARRPVRDAHPRHPRHRREGPQLEDRPRLCDLSRHRRDRGARASRRSSPGSTKIKALNDQGRLSRARSPRPTAPASAARSAPASARTTRRPTSMRSSLAPVRASACPTAIIISATDAKLVETRKRLSRAHRQDADAGRRAQCRRARHGVARVRDRDRQGQLDPRRQPRRRPRPTTR